MAGYLLYFPKSRGANPATLAECGLESLQGGGSGPSWADILTAGPDGGMGRIAFWDDPMRPDATPTPGYLPERQIWTPAADGRWWLGVENLRPPTPDDLRRPKLHAGVDVVLEGGFAWHIPIAKQLPHILGIGSARIKDQYKPFYDAAWKALDEWLIVDGDSPKWRIPQDEGFRFIATALGQNYRLEANIVGMLGLVSTEHLVPCIEAITEGWALEAMLNKLKKKLEAQSLNGSEPIAVGEPG